MNVVILTPIYQASKFFPMVAADLYKLNPQPERYIFAENNSSDRTLELVARFHRKKEVIRLWFRDDAIDCCETRYDLIAIMRQVLLQRARQLDPDYAVFLDSDVIVQSRDLLERLTGWPNADIVGGPYFRRYPTGLFLAALWPIPGGASQEFHVRVLPCTDDPLEEVAAVGGGCMCLPRRILQDRRLNFYPVKRDGVDASEDYGYCLAAKQLGYRVFLDTAVELRHWATRKHIDGKPWRVDEAGVPVPFHYGA